MTRNVIFGFLQNLTGTNNYSKNTRSMKIDCNTNKEIKTKLKNGFFFKKKNFLRKSR